MLEMAVRFDGGKVSVFTSRGIALVIANLAASGWGVSRFREFDSETGGWVPGAGYNECAEGVGAGEHEEEGGELGLLVV